MAWTQIDLDAIEEAIASGTLRVEYNDRTIVYRSIDELLKAREAIKRALGLSKRGGRLLTTAKKGTC